MFDQITSTFGQFITLAGQTLRYPADNPLRTGSVVAVLLAVIALIVLGALFARMSFVGRAQGKAARGVAVFDRDRGMRLLRFAGVVIVLIVVAGQYGARPDVCRSCHASVYTSFKKSPHQSVGCLSCHQEPGATGYTLEKFDYARWLIASQSQGAERSVEASVSNDTCLSCHADIETGTARSGRIKVRHSDFIRYPCTSCHNTTGHSEGVAVAKAADMANCVVCHNAKKASAGCSTCHTGDIANVASKDSQFVKVAATQGTDCKGCHSTEKCVACHGLEMPHPTDWVPSHARLAFTNKAICWRCHTEPGKSQYAFCDQCHRFPSPHQNKDWIHLHGLAAAKDPAGGNIRNCRLCHANQKFCDLCHTGLKETLVYTTAGPSPTQWYDKSRTLTPGLLGAPAATSDSNSN